MVGVLALAATLVVHSAAGAPGPGQKAPPPPARWAIFIGDAAPDLRGPLEAAQRAAAATLRAQYGYADENVIEIYGAGATQSAIREAIASLRRRMRAADTLFAYILLPSVERKGGVFLVPAGGRDDEVWTLIGHDELASILAQWQPKALLAVVSACTEPAAPRRMRKTQSAARPAAGVSMLTFCDDGARDGGTRRFAEAFAGALRSPAAKERLSDGDLTLRLRESLPGTRIELQRDVPYAEDGFAFVVERRRADALLGQLKTAETPGAQRRAVDALAGAGRSAADAETRTAIAKGIADVARDESAPPASRIRAIGALGDSGSAAVVPDLAAVAAAASGGEPEVRRAAVQALARIGTPDTLGPLHKALGDPSGIVRIAAVRGTGTHKSLASAGPVLAAVGDADPDVRVAALQMLAFLAKPALGGPNLITPIARRAGKAAQGALADKSAGVRREAVNTLARLGGDLGRNRTILTLLAADPDATVRATVALTLGREYRGLWKGNPTSAASYTPNVQRDPALSALLDATRSSSTAVRAAAMWSLGEIGDSRARPVLAAGLQDPEARIREAAAEALGKLRDSQAVPGIITLLEDDSANIRAAAARALGTIRDPRASEPLLNRFKVERDAYVRQAVEEALHRLPSPSMRAIEAALRDEAAQVRREAVERLAETSDPSAGGFAVDRLGDDDPAVREAALAAVTRRGAEWFDAVVAGLSSPVPAVRFNAAAALGAIGSADAGTALLARFGREPSPPVRAQIAAALGAVEPAADIETALAAAALEPDPLLRAAAAWALRRYPGTRVREMLQALAEDDHPDVRDHAIRSLRAGAQ